MKKIFVAMLIVVLFAAQGIVLAEDVKADVQAKAENAVADAQDSANMIVEDTIVAEELVGPQGDDLTMIEEEEDVVPAEQKEV